MYFHVNSHEKIYYQKVEINFFNCYWANLMYFATTIICPFKLNSALKCTEQAAIAPKI